MSTHNIGLYEDLTKLSLNYHQISSNTHLISSADNCMLFEIKISRLLPRPMLDQSGVSMATHHRPSWP